MLDINHILVVLDKEHPEQVALDRAIWLAKSLDADLTLLTSVYEPYCESNSSLDAETRSRIKASLISKAEEWLGSFIDEAADLSVCTEVHWQKHLHDAVTEAINKQAYDLVIKSTLQHGIMDRIFTHTDWNLLRHCPAPVMLVKNAAPWKNNRVVAAIDATSADDGHQLINDNILSYAEHLSDHFSTDLHMVNSYPLVSVAFAMVPEVTAPDNIQQYITEQHDESCKQWAKKYNISEDHIHIGEGDADTVIANICEKIEADVLVIGTVGREGLSGVLIGNTAELVVDKVDCDIIVIKPSDGVAPDAD